MPPLADQLALVEDRKGDALARADGGILFEQVQRIIQRRVPRLAERTVSDACRKGFSGRRRKGTVIRASPPAYSPIMQSARL